MINFLKGKIQTKNEDLRKTIHGSFMRSLMIYFFTTLDTAGAVGMQKFKILKKSLEEKYYFSPMISNLEQ